MKKKKLGEVLRDRGKISPADLQNSHWRTAGKADPPWRTDAGAGPGCQGRLGGGPGRSIATSPTWTAPRSIPDPEALKLVPRSMAERLCVLPLRMEQKRLIVAMAAPQNLAALDELRFKTGMGDFPAALLSDRTAAGHRKSLRRRRKEPRLVRDCPAGRNEIQFEEMEFISTSSRQANQEAIQEVQADLRQKKTPAVRLVSEMHSSGDGQAGQRYSHRAASLRHRRAHARGRRVARSSIDPARPAKLADLAGQDSLRYGYLGAPRPPGRAIHGFHGRAAARSASLDPADTIRRKGCDPVAGDERAADFLHRPGNAGRRCRGAHGASIRAPRHDSGDGTDRLGQEHDSLLFAPQTAPVFGQHRHGGGPRRVCAPRHQSGACQYQGRPDVCELPAVHSPPGSEHHHGGRDSRSEKPRKSS